MKQFDSPFGLLDLGRHPYDSTPNLQAWNAADELLLGYAKDHFTPDSRVLVLNDTFGALSVALLKGGHRVVHSTDSSLSQRAVLSNLEHLRISEQGLVLLDSLQIPRGHFDGVLIKLPKSNGFLSWQLSCLGNLEVPLVAAGMTKDIHSSTIKIFEKYRKKVTTSFAEKKARMILAVEGTVQPVPASGFPQVYSLSSLQSQVVAHAGVFSSAALDEGTAFLLKNFPKGISPQRIIDLGCGTGLLGLAAARSFPHAEVFLVDESFMAVWSARETFRANGMGSRGVFLTGDCLEDFSPAYADLILCNPPFHFQNVQTQEVARKMLQDAKRVLKPGGQLWLVANSHLGYHVEMKILFSDLKITAKNEKFIVFRALV